MDNANRGKIKFINAIMASDSKIFCEGDLVTIKDNWEHTYTGIMTSLDVDGFEIVNGNKSAYIDITNIEYIAAAE